MKLLFVCNQGENRSKTAKDYKTKSAGHSDMRLS